MGKSRVIFARATEFSWIRVLACGLVTLVLTAPQLVAGDTEWAGDFRLYPFFALGDIPFDRRDAETLALRGRVMSYFADDWRLEAHAVVEARSPGLDPFGSSLVVGTTSRYFDLETTLVEDEDLLAVALIDRLNVRWEGETSRVTIGRQALTWGVNYFWPVLDLFGPFAPERLDRTYKPGVDAIRWVESLGDFSEVDTLFAQQGEEFGDDSSVGTLGRFHRGSSDFGPMIGRFHTDTVVGAFVTSDLKGTGYRGEVIWTDSGDPLDAEIGRSQFTRLTLGADRQLSPRWSLVGEMHYNGFGSADPEDYRRLAESDRVRRGEITSLGEGYVGVSTAWQFRPLLTISMAVIGNLGDRSTLFQPTANWSSSENSSVQFGVIVGTGKGLQTRDDGTGSEAVSLGSEFGGVPVTVWGSYQVYF